MLARSFNGGGASLEIEADRAVSPTLVERNVRAASREDAAAHGVLMSICVETVQLACVRCLLHRLLGPDIDIYTVAIDNRKGRACLQIEIAASHVAQAMSLIMQGLPKAEFGAIRRSPRAPMH